MSEGEKTGILPNGYWREKDKLSLRSNLVSKAAALEHASLSKQTPQGAETPQIVASLSRLRGPDNPRSADLMADKMVSYGVPNDSIIRSGDSYSTGGEINHAVKTAGENGWTKIVDIAFSEHLKSIKILFKRLGKGVKVEYKSAEDILREKDVHKFKKTYRVRKPLDLDKDGKIVPWKKVPIAERQYAETGEVREINHDHNHTAHLLDRLKRSRYERVYKWLYEFPKRQLLKLGMDPEKLEEKQKKARETTDPQKEFPIPFDVYKLNGKRAEAPLPLRALLSIPGPLTIAGDIKNELIHLKRKIRPAHAQ